MKVPSNALLLLAAAGVGVLMLTPAIGGTTSNVKAISEAIANAEGFYVIGSRPNRNNNPGDLRGWGQYPQDGDGFTIFPSVTDGWNALYTQVSKILSGNSAFYTPDMSIAQIGEIYSPGSGDVWASNVAAKLGVSPDTPIGQVSA